MNIPVHYVYGEPVHHKLTFGDFMVGVILLAVGCILGAWLGMQVIQHWVSFDAPEQLYTSQNTPSDVRPIATPDYAK